MKLSPVYQHYVAELVGIIMTKAILVGIGPMDQNQLVLIALLCQDQEIRAKLHEELQDKGELICQIWNGYCEAVNQHNAEGVALTNINISTLLERAKQNANRG